MQFLHVVMKVIVQRILLFTEETVGLMIFWVIKLKLCVYSFIHFVNAVSVVDI